MGSARTGDSATVDEPAEVRLLGDVRVVIGGRDLALGGPTNQLVLALLLLAGGEVVVKERLVEAIWGEEPPDAESALRVAITRLRKRLAPTGWTIVNQRSGYRLDGALALDVHRLDDLEERVRNAASTDECFAAALAAARLWTGPALGAVRDLEVGARLAARLDRRRLALRRVLYERAGSSAQLRQCGAEFAEWTADDALDEMAACAHASALAAEGRTTAALRHLSRTREALADVGLDTGRALADLELRLLTNASPAPSLPDLSPGAFPAALAALAERPLIGRATDLAELARVWRRSANGMQVVRVTGPTGVGKSSLLAHFAAQQHQGGAAVAYAACDPDSARPLLVVGDLVRQLDPDIDVRTWAAAGQHDEGPAARAAVIELAALDLAKAIGRQPTLAIVDDMRWIDELSLAVLRRLLGLQPLCPAVIAIGERDISRPRLADRRIASRTLAPLHGRALQRWIGRTTSWTVAELEALTGGLPLLVEAALTSAVPGDPGNLTHVGVALFEDQTSGLTEEVLDTVAAAALLGKSFTIDDLAAVRHRPEMDVVEHVDAGIRHGLILDDTTGTLAFRHEVFRRAALARWSAFRVARTHAEVLICTGLVERDPLRAIRHAEHAGDLLSRGIAIQVALAAGRQQHDAKAYADARRSLELGARRIVGSPRSVGEVALLSLLASCLAISGETEASVALFDRALEGARLIDDAALLVDVFLARGVLTPTARAESNLFAEMVGLLPRIGALPVGTQSAFLRQVARLSRFEGRPDLTAELRTTMAALLPRLELPEDRVNHWQSVYSLVSDIGDRDRRREVVSEIVDLVRDDPWLARNGFAALASEHLRTGDLEQAAAFLDSALESFRVAGNSYSEWLASAMRFTVEFLRGDLEAADQRSRYAHQRGVEMGIRAAGDTRGVQHFALRWVAGDLAGQVGALRTVAEGPFGFPWRCALALALAASGRMAEAGDVLDSCVAEVPSQSAKFLGSVGVAEAAEAAWLVGHREFAAAALPVLAARRGEHILLGSAVMDFGPALRYEALCTDVLGRADAGVLLRQVVEQPASCPLWRRRAAVDLAAVDDRAPWPDGDGWGWMKKLIRDRSSLLRKD